MNWQIDRIEGAAMAVNSYVVHGPGGVVVIDGQLTVDDAVVVRTAVERSGVPLVGVLITHPHPDHYAGIATIVGGDNAVPIVSTPDVDTAIRRDDAHKSAVFGPLIGGCWPTGRIFPNHLVKPGDSIELGGLSFTAHGLGIGESAADTLWELDNRTIFTGDFVCNDTHPNLADCHFTEWIYQLDRVHAVLDTDATLYVGHGEPGPKQLLVRQRFYVEAFINAVHAAADRDPQDRAAAVTADMRQFVANDRLLHVMQLSIEPVLAAINEKLDPADEHPKCALPGCDALIKTSQSGTPQRYCSSAHRSAARQARHTARYTISTLETDGARKTMPTEQVGGRSSRIPVGKLERERRNISRSTEGNPRRGVG